MTLDSEKALFDVKGFESYVSDLMAKTGVPGLGVGICKDGEMVYFKGFGLADMEKKRPVMPDTVFGLASVTKSFTALCINQLAEAGRLSLLDPVKKYLPEFELPKKGWAERITIHNFLSHTSGMPPLPALGYASQLTIPVDEQGNLGERPRADGIPAIIDNRDLMKFIASHSFDLLGEPGEYISYSNDCFSLLGEVIERVSGKAFEDYLRENVWGPIGMDHTFIDVRKIKDFDVQGLYYKDKEGKVTRAPWYHRDVYLSSGSIKSSVRDLLKYVQMYMDRGVAGGKQVASESTVDRMITPYYKTGPGTYYAYGFVVRPNYAPGVSLIQHGGGNLGVASNIGFIPEKRIGVVVLSNLQGFQVAKVWFAAVNSMLGLPLEYQSVNYPTVELPSDQLAKFAGRYMSGEGMEIIFAVEDGKIRAQMGGKTVPARPVGYDSLAINIGGEEDVVTFLFNAKGEAWALRSGLRIVQRVQGGLPAK